MFKPSLPIEQGTFHVLIYVHITDFRQYTDIPVQDVLNREYILRLSVSHERQLNLEIGATPVCPLSSMGSNGGI